MLQRAVSIAIGVILASIPTYLLWGLFKRSPCLSALSWDPACHARDGILLFNNLTTFSFGSFWHWLTTLTHWPPLPPILSIPMYALFGKSIVAPTMVSLLSFFLLILVAYIFFWKQFKKPWIASLSTLAYLSFILSSPILLRYGLLIMYEMPGALFTLIASIAYWLALNARASHENKKSLRYYSITSLATLGLLLIKWNYGLQFAVFLIVVELLLSTKAYLRRLFTEFILPLLDLRVFKLLSILNGLSALLVLSIATTGGWILEHPIKVSMTKIDNPVYILYLLMLIKVSLFLKKSYRSLNWIEPFHQRLFFWAVVPYALWLLYPHPNRFKSLLYHLNYGEHSAPLLSAKTVMFYLNALSEEYLLGQTHLWILLALLITGLVLAIRSKNVGMISIVGFALFCWFSATFFSKNKDPRFLLNIVPVYFLIAAWVVGHWIQKTPVATVALLILFGLPLGSMDRIQSFFRGENSDQPGWYNFEQRWCNGNERLVQRIQDQIASPLSGSRNFVVIGIHARDSFCPQLEWELHRAHPQYSKYPKPNICGYGYGVNVDDYVFSRLSENNLEWIVYLRKQQGNDSKVEKIYQFLEDSKRYQEKRVISLPEIGYSGFLYQIRLSEPKFLARARPAENQK